LFVFATDAPAQSWPRGDAERKQILTDEFRTTGWEAPRILAALAAAHDIYFDPVSQIRLDLWARGRTSLVGDAAFCPSLLAGQGSALAMAASYVLAGELAATGGQYQEAFARYDHRLRRFILGKQRTAEKYARAFVPRTEFGLWFRDSVSRLIGVPGLATLVLGRGLLDRLRLPDYPNALDQSS
jgi:2-polyprenyl-6-methoxyphenol hydroxylase-like FAD-dependent oxidoreductase